MNKSEAIALFSHFLLVRSWNPCPRIQCSISFSKITKTNEILGLRLTSFPQEVDLRTVEYIAGQEGDAPFLDKSQVLSTGIMLLKILSLRLQVIVFRIRSLWQHIIRKNRFIEVYH